MFDDTSHLYMGSGLEKIVGIVLVLVPDSQVFI